MRPEGASVPHRWGAGDCAKPHFLTTTGLSPAPHESGILPDVRLPQTAGDFLFRARGFGVGCGLGGALHVGETGISPARHAGPRSGIQQASVCEPRNQRRQLRESLTAWTRVGWTPDQVRGDGGERNACSLIAERNCPTSSAAPAAPPLPHGWTTKTGQSASPT